MKRARLMICSLILLAWGTHAAAEAASLPTGLGKATWGMTEPELISLYRITLAPPQSESAEGAWAVEGPAPGELTVSGEALGDSEARSVSFGFHPEWGLSIIHVRFKGIERPSSLDGLLSKWTARYGPPKERLPGPKVIWEDAVTHIELTYHVVSPLHPTPSDHFALVLWSIPLMEKGAPSGEGINDGDDRRGRDKGPNGHDRDRESGRE